MNQNRQSKTGYQPPTGSDAELAQPSVIVDMPEVEKAASRKKWLNRGGYIGGAVVFFILLSLIILQLINRGKGSSDSDAMITLTVKVNPSTTGVYVDGQQLTGDPLQLRLPASSAYHSIEAKAKGYETVAKDVKLERSTVVEFNLKKAKTTGGVSGRGDDAVIEEIEVSDEVIVYDDPGNIRTSRIAPRRTAQGGNRVKEKSADNGTAKVVEIFSPSSNNTSSSAPKEVSSSEGAKSGWDSVAPSSGTVPTKAQPPETSWPPPSTPPSQAGDIEKTSSLDRTKGTLAIRVPQGATSPVSVSVDEKKRGNAPLSIILSPGLHEVVFIYEGKRTFRMVNIKAGQVKRVTPSID